MEIRGRSCPSLTVLGGGVAGLAIAFYARQQGLRTTVYEAQVSPGGLCLTFEHDGFLFDSGAHRFHDKDPDITRDVQRLLGDRLHPVDRPSMVFDGNRLMKFPFGLTDALWHLGPKALARNTFEMATARLTGRLPQADSFANFAVRRYGRTVAERFLLNYSQKLWGLPCERLSARVSGGRLNGLDLRQFLLHTVLGRRGDARNADGRFFYPTRGIGVLTEALAKGAGPDAIRTGVAVTRLHHDHRRIRAIDANGAGRTAVDDVASTLPIGQLLAMLDPAPPKRILRHADTLTHRDLIIVALFLDKASVTSAATVYFPDPGVPFTRITEPRNRSAAMSPPGRTSLVAEIPCVAGGRIWNAEDPEITDLVTTPLRRIGWIRDGEFLGSKVVRMRYAYPVLALEAEESVNVVRDYLGRFENLTLAGRSGRFEYGWLHEMLRHGKDIVEARVPVSSAARSAGATR
jgi:protoporphyrinogen oxidase